MDRPRRIVFFVVFFLTVLLPCTDMCLEAGKVQGMTVSSATPHGRAHGRCHSSPVTPQDMPSTCPVCGSHVFLLPLPPGTVTGIAPGPVLALLCPHGPTLTPALRQQDVTIAASPGTAPRPRFLTRAVLRL